MDKSRSYYQRVYERFGHKEVKCQQGDHGELGGGADSTTVTTKEKEDDELVTHYAKFVGNRRSAKALLKLHEDVIDFYKQSMGNIKAKTMKKYALIISQFMIFSPTLDPKDVPGFLEFKFPQESIDANSNQSKNSTIKQYISHIKRFLYILYKDELNKYSDWFSKYNLVKTPCIHSPLTIEICYNAYTTLIDQGLIQDSLFIHLLFSLGTSVNTLYYLSHDCITDQRVLTYWDVQNSGVKTVILSQELYRDINYFKTYKEINKIETFKQLRALKDGTEVSGNFILSLSPSGIYSRFSKNFGGNLNGFHYTPNDISKLSEKLISMSKNEGGDVLVSLDWNQI